jgi:hypothetical protein
MVTTAAPLLPELLASAMDAANCLTAARKRATFRGLIEAVLLRHEARRWVS